MAKEPWWPAWVSQGSGGALVNLDTRTALFTHSRDEYVLHSNYYKREGNNNMTKLIWEGTLKGEGFLL